MQSKFRKQFCVDHDITSPTFYSIVNAGLLRVFKIGRLTRISDAAEAQYIAESEERALEEAPEASARARALVLGTSKSQAA